MQNQMLRSADLLFGVTVQENLIGESSMFTAYRWEVQTVVKLYDPPSWVGANDYPLMQTVVDMDYVFGEGVAPKRFAVWTGTDHSVPGPNAGIGRHNIDNLINPNTVTDVGQQIGDDFTGGTQPEWPQVLPMYDEAGEFLYLEMFAHNVGLGVGQSTWRATSTDMGDTWVDQGIAIDIPPQNGGRDFFGVTGDGHTGNATIFSLGGTDYALTLLGGGTGDNQGSGGLWSRPRAKSRFTLIDNYKQSSQLTDQSFRFTTVWHSVFEFGGALWGMAPIRRDYLHANVVVAGQGYVGGMIGICQIDPYFFRPIGKPQILIDPNDAGPTDNWRGNVNFASFGTADESNGTVDILFQGYANEDKDEMAVNAARIRLVGI